MSHGQTKVSEYYSKRKIGDVTQPSKLRKVVVDEESTATYLITPPVGCRTRSRVSKPTTPMLSNFTKAVDGGGTKGNRTRKAKTVSKILVKPTNQQTIKQALERMHDRSVSDDDRNITQAIATAVCDNHNSSPPGTPTKIQQSKQDISRKRSRHQQVVRKDVLQEEGETAFKFEKDSVNKVRTVLSPRRLSTDTEQKDSVFEFKGHEKDVLKKEKIKELIGDFTKASDEADTSDGKSSVVKKGRCLSSELDSTAAIQRGSKDSKTDCVTALETMQEKAKAAMKNPTVLKARLAKCTNLNDLKAKLQQLQSSSPKKMPQKPSVQSPIKSKLTNTTTKQSSAAVVKKPAYERFASLEESIPPGLTLPKTHKLLLDMFIGMDTVVSILHKRAEVCTFSKLKAAVQQITKRNFELKHLAQMKTIYPTAYNFKQEKNLPCYGKKRSNDYQLTIEANLTNDPFSKNCDITVFTKDGHPDFTTTKIIERKAIFHQRLINMIHKHHKEFLSGLNPPISIPDCKVTRWHPKFRLEAVPEIEQAELPRAQNATVITTAKEALQHAREKFGNTSRVVQALENVAAKNVDANARNIEQTNRLSPKPDSSVPKHSDDKQALKGVSQSFIDKIRAKEARKQQEAMLRSPADEKKRERMSRLPELVRILRTFFVTSKKPALLKVDVLEKLSDSYKACMGQAEAESHLNLLIELVPEWISVVSLKRGIFVTIDRNKDINAVIDTLRKLLKEMP